ncbi:MAG TPA: DNA polymerase III subunit gamma/tau, partial [Candidatus Bathyarchaeia archaeon]|nr:DNA polymerase III subunit gamma/tau [Candidatus Bathyarchaeia archaeon]
MSYLVLARKYRPNLFDDVVGQGHITDILKNAITSDRLGQAYLFCGPRGIGKTSCARILAKALNCEKGVAANPCGVCSSCQSIALGNSFDILEIDGASNRGIDEIRTIRENVKFAPSYGRYKVYIVDEVHMLTTEAFNALLKTLEEPPEHVKFVFATTDPNKLPATIISRCQRFDFKRISFKELCESLEAIAGKEKIKVDQDAIYAIAKAASGSFRDALSILDQIAALSGQAIKGDDVYHMLGLVEMDLLFSVVDALGAGDCAQALQIFDSIVDKGKDVKQLNKDLIEHFRHLMIIKLAGSSVAKIKEMGRLVDYPGEIKDQFLKQSRLFELKEILAAIDVFINAQETARITESERTPLEIAFAKLTLSLNRPPVAAAPDIGEVPQVLPGEEKKSAPVSSASSAKTAASGYFPGSMIKNKKGQVNPLVGKGAAQETEPEEGEEDLALGDEAVTAALPQAAVTLERITSMWDSLTHAVSRERMSLATYLQEGFPSRLRDSKL